MPLDMHVSAWGRVGVGFARVGSSLAVALCVWRCGGDGSRVYAFHVHGAGSY